MAGSKRKREKLCNIAQHFANIENMQRGGSQQILGQGTGIKGYGKQEA